jgi:hypothetical protein
MVKKTKRCKYTLCILWTVAIVAVAAVLALFNGGLGDLTGEAFKVLPSATCYDTDAGMDPTTYGYIYGETMGGTQYNSTDFCRDSDVLVENFCNGNAAKARNYPCPKDGLTCLYDRCQ